ncbi:MAG TPA: alpha,alpha-trehalose-phosphate synthase (UDP-forming) [Alphaproteobacteria bacterium]|nr:alpha,alpha-trehalose-phosphate synthase (UDP-forming) [Alphaproteobacteria bacterium]
MSDRLIVVSNRVAAVDEKKGAVGGLAIGMLAALRASGGLWFGWSGRIDHDQADASPTIVQRGGITYVTLNLSPKDYAGYYNGYANRTLWPLFHYRLHLTDYDRQDCATYLNVNRSFAEKLAPLLRLTDLIWVNDYHLIPLAEALRSLGLVHRMGFFLHTPFPAPQVLTALPNHEQIIRQMMAYDVIGFQTAVDLRAFRDYIRFEADGIVEADGRVTAFGRTALADAFPIGIDTDDLAGLAEDAETSTKTERLRLSLLQRDLIIGVDRLDYSKGLVERFCAYERFLELFPKRRTHVVLMQIAPPTRSDVPEYQEIRRTLERRTGHINGRFAEPDWVPIRYLNRSFSRKVLAGYYRTSRIGLITPLRDGMNLVAKEYVAAQDPNDPGVLVLSQFAGAAQELDTALIVNPFDTDGVAEAIEQALSMSLEERQERWQAMMNQLRRQNISVWRESFLEKLSAAPYRAEPAWPRQKPLARSAS